jgi:hypothetical protein
LKLFLAKFILVAAQASLRFYAYIVNLQNNQTWDEKTKRIQDWGTLPLIPALRRLRQEDWEFRANLDSQALSQTNKTKKKHGIQYP